MANAALSLIQLANIACEAGMQVGFNAAEVQRLCYPELSGTYLHIQWGDARLMKAARLRPPMEYALAYSEGDPCMRDARSIDLPESAVFEASYDLRTRFIDALLEIAPS